MENLGLPQFTFPKFPQVLINQPEGEGEQLSEMHTD